MSARRRPFDDSRERAINYGTLSALVNKIEMDMKSIEDRISELNELYKDVSGRGDPLDRVRYKMIMLQKGVGPGFPVVLMDDQPESFAYYVRESLEIYRLEYKKLAVLRQELNELVKKDLGDAPIMYLLIGGVPSRIVIFPKVIEKGGGGVSQRHVNNQ